MDEQTVGWKSVREHLYMEELKNHTQIIWKEPCGLYNIELEQKFI